jgi:hypothetical protein
VDATQFDAFDRLPERPADPAPDFNDPIGAMIDLADPVATGSTPGAAR